MWRKRENRISKRIGIDEVDGGPSDIETSDDVADMIAGDPSDRVDLQSHALMCLPTDSV